MLFKHFSEDFRKFRIFKIFRLWGIPGSENIFLGARRFSAAWKSAHFFTLRGIPGPLRQISKICSTVTSPWDRSTAALFWNFWKSIKKCAHKLFGAKKICEKSIFRIREFPKIEKFWKFETFQNRQKIALRAFWNQSGGVLGEKWRFGVRLKWDNAIILE